MSDPLGTLYLDPATGDVYRMWSHGASWQMTPRKMYEMHRSNRTTGLTSFLPESAVKVWEPGATVLSPQFGVRYEDGSVNGPTNLEMAKYLTQRDGKTFPIVQRHTTPWEEA